MKKLTLVVLALASMCFAWLRPTADIPSGYTTGDLLEELEGTNTCTAMILAREFFAAQAKKIKLIKNVNDVKIKVYSLKCIRRDKVKYSIFISLKTLETKKNSNKKILMCSKMQAIGVCILNKLNKTMTCPAKHVFLLQAEPCK